MSANMWHSCTTTDLAHFFDGKDRELRRVFDAIVQAVRKIGAVEVLPQMTRITFLAQTRFAGVTRVGRDSLTLSIGLPRREASTRVQKATDYNGWWVNEVRLRRVSDVDAELVAWLSESYHMMGMRRRFSKGRA